MALLSLAATGAPVLDEAVRALEARRQRRMLADVRLPLIYALGAFGFGLALTMLPLSRAGPGGESPEGAPAGFFFIAAAGAAALGGFLRAQQLWNEERRLRHVEHWLLTRQEPARVARTTVAMATVLGLWLAAAPTLVALALGCACGMSPVRLLLSAALVALCAAWGAAAGAAGFFVACELVPRRLSMPPLIGLALAAALLWLRAERIENGWVRPWEERPARLLRSAGLLTPGPALYAMAVPEWWDNAAAASLGLRLPGEALALIQAALLLAGAAFGTSLAVVGYRRLAEDPSRLRDPVPLAADLRATSEAGSEHYWQGFRNPIWTRDIRTRLRSRETAEFIFFASVAVAAGGFVPLTMTARDLSDPLMTATAARQVFFWLTITLLALVSLVGAGLTADAISLERTRGTLESLVVTPLRPEEILVGKWLGAMSVLLLLASPSLPLFGLCYLFHGASGPQVLGVCLVTIGSLAGTAFIGLMQSAICSRPGWAKFWSYALSGLFVLGPGGPWWLAVAIAAPEIETRRAFAGYGLVWAVAGLFWGFVLALLWGNAREQLAYAEP